MPEFSSKKVEREEDETGKSDTEIKFLFLEARDLLKQEKSKKAKKVFLNILEILVDRVKNNEDALNETEGLPMVADGLLDEGNFESAEEILREIFEMSRERKEENEDKEIETSTEELSGILEQFSNKREVVKVGDESRQLFVGEIKDAGEFIEVEVLLGCDRLALVYMMHKINEQTGKEVRAVFGDGKEIVIEMEDPDKKE